MSERFPEQANPRNAEPDNRCFNELTFEEEIMTPYIEGDHSVRILNRKTGFDEGIRPVVIALGLGITALDKMGAYQLREYAKTIRRPLITFDPPGIGELKSSPHTSRRLLAHEYLNRLDILDVIKMDAVGTSVGGVVMAELAVTAQHRMERLVTVSSVGVLDNMKDYLPALPAEGRNLRREMRHLRSLRKMGSLHEAGSSSLFQPTKMRAHWAFAQLALGRPLYDLPEALSRQTFWTDIVGDKDRLSPAVHHEAIFAERENRAPGMTSLYVIDHGHTWAPWDRDLHNKFVRDALEGGAAAGDTVQ